MLILDTHAVIWWSLEPQRLSKRAERAIGETPALGIPTICFWETSLLLRKGKLTMEMDVADWAQKILSIDRVRALPLSVDAALLSDTLNMHPDPADRMIVATAVLEDAKLVTRDRLIRDLKRYVSTVW